MHINMSRRLFTSKVTKTKLVGTAKPITVTIPTGKMDTKGNIRGFVANLIHSLDASHINLIIKNIAKDRPDNLIPIYTIHDCYATTPNNMASLNKIVLSSFIEQYFDSQYIIKLHRNLLEQIKSYKLIVNEDGDEYLIHPKTQDRIKVPKIPETILNNWEKNKDIFIKGITKSKYFIS